MVIENLLNEIFSALFNDTVTGFRKQSNEKKVKDQISDGINRVIEDEKENQYYDALDRAVYNSQILQDYASSLKEGSDRFDLEKRLQSLGKQVFMTDAERIYVIPVIRRLCQIIEDGIRSNLNDDTKFLAGEIANSTRQLERKLDEINDRIGITASTPLSAYPSHSIPEHKGIPLIKRYIIPAELSDHTDTADSIPSPIECIEQDQLILLLSTAGSGKTYTLYQMFDEAESNHYQVIFYRLNEIDRNPSNALKALAEGEMALNDVEDDNAIILLDGYDEMLKEGAHDWLAQTMREIIKNYPGIHIVVSSRSNADYHPLETIGFKPYRIKPLNQKDIEKYLEESGVNKEMFIKQVEINDLSDFCRNAFYLAEMVSIWRQEKSLPSTSKLMEGIITKRIYKDSDKYETISTVMERQIQDTRYRFERIALIMQCMHRDYLTKDELLRITGDKDQAILEYHGLWEKDNQDRWKFAHNNFREYFAAVALSKKSLEGIKGFIGCGIDSPFIRPSWHNTLSYLVALGGDEDLLNWIVSIQPELILLFERDRFSTRKRAGLFIKLMEQIKEDHQWLDLDYSYRQKLALFATSPDAVRYTIDELKSDIPIRQKQNLLRCLQFFDTFYEHGNDVAETVLGIASTPDYPDYYRADALYVMEHHPKAFYDRAEKVAEILRTATEETVRYGALLFLQASGTAEAYFDAVIVELERCREKHPTLISLKITTDRIINNIEQEASAYVLLSYMRDNIAHIYGDFEDDAFMRCCQIGAAMYCGNDDRILKCLIEIVKAGYMLISHEKFHAIRKYMLETNTVSLFLDAVWEQKIVFYRAGMLYDLMSDEMALVLLDYVSSGRICFSDLKTIISLLPYNDPWQTKLIEMVYFKTGESIIIDPPVDYEAKQKREHQAFFDVLFDERAFSDLADKVCTIMGEKTPIGKSITHADADKLTLIHENKMLSDWYYLIRRIVPDDSPVTFGEYKKTIGDWDAFRFCAAEETLKNHEESIDISDHQREWLSQYTLETLHKYDIKSAFQIKDGRFTYPMMLSICLSVMELIEIECDRDLAIQLLSIPSPILKAESPDQLPEYAVKWLDEQTITSTIIANVHAGELNPYTASAYVHYCLNHEVIECKADIIAYLIDKDRNCGFVFAEVEYITKLFGEDVLLEEVLPHCDDDRLLECIATHIHLRKESDELDRKLWSWYRKTEDTKWLKHLINRNNVNALEEYLKLCRESLVLPDSRQRRIDPEVTDAIRAVYMVECLDSVIGLLMVASDPRFVEREEAGFGLTNSCWGAITSIAKSNYSLTVDALEANKHRGNDVFSEWVGDIIHKIKSNKEYANDAALSFENAFMLTAR